MLPRLPFRGGGRAPDAGALVDEAEPDRDRRLSNVQRPGPIVLLGLMVLGVDLLFVALHAVVSLRYLDTWTLDLTVDHSYPEMFQYIKLLWLAGLCGLLAVRPGGWGWFAWVLAFGVLLLDDALLIHERLGQQLVNGLNLPAAFGLRPQDFGEMSIWAVQGVVLLPLLLLGYWRSGGVNRALMRWLVLLGVLLVVCGGAFDMLGIALGAGGVLGTVVEVLEDGGEMIAVSLMVIVVFAGVLADPAQA